MRKRIMTVLALAMSLFLVAGVAYAQEAPTESDFQADGDLWARGHGRVVLDSSGVVNMRVEGRVVVRDFAGDAEIIILDGPNAAETQRADEPGTTVVLPGFSGHIKVKGSDFLIKARGNLSFLAKGSGTAYLEGAGRWHAPGISGTWSGVTIQYS